MTSRKRKTPSKTPPVVELTFFIVCDEIRFEAQTNKAMLLGVYTGLLIGRTDPVPLDRITFVFAFSHAVTYRPQIAKLKLTAAPSLDVLPIATFDISAANATDAAGLIMAEFRNVKLPSGEYVMTLVLDDSVELHGKFVVRIKPSLTPERTP
jgi:hypothetical protein